jgi:diguanylate cyclase (GGDEF)-like protein/PAS domain S-box-containing protein
MFFIFGLLIAIVTTYINYYLQFQQIDKKVEEDSKNTSRLIKMKIHTHMQCIERNINSLKHNKLFINYILFNDQESKDIAKNLFLNIVDVNINLFQLRFIDANGMEKIRVDRKSNKDEVVAISDEKLQNKFHRYYFQESMNYKPDRYWHSKLDLNIENKEIEKPIKPTYRVSSPVYYKGKFYGVIIINIEMKFLLNSLRLNNDFNIYIADKDGYFIIGKDKEQDFSRYLKTGHTVFTAFNNLTESEYKTGIIKDKNIFMTSLKDEFDNSEDLRLILEVKDTFLSNIYNNNITFAITLGVVVLLSSIPLGMIISIPASNLLKMFNKVYQDNVRHMDIIDKYVITMNVDLDKNITNVSEAMCNVTGYTKKELIGKKPSILKSGKMNNEVYKDLWSKITNGLVWVGELQNMKKNREYFWVKSTILPNYTDNEIDSYSAISEDVTDKKVIEKISQQDKLTELYNRVKLDDCLEVEMDRFMRYNSLFSIILIDIDYFKQVNDTYGHQVGDSVLIEFANILREYTRNVDIVGRWGGEEFMIICSETNISGAVKLAEKLREEIERFDFKVVGHKSASFGVSEFGSHDNIETLVKRVDENLYKAKESGRNRVVDDTFVS